MSMRTLPRALDLPGVHLDFELDEAANLGSIFLRRMLSEKEPVKPLEQL